MGKLVLIFVACLFVLIMFFWVMGWVTMPFQKTSVENVQAQWAFAYSYEESLKAEARQVCSAQKSLATAEDPNEKIQRRTQIEIYEMNYARIQGEYDAKLRNAFEARYIKPSDVPDRAPSLEQMKYKVCQ